MFFFPFSSRKEQILLLKKKQKKTGGLFFFEKKRVFLNPGGRHITKESSLSTESLPSNLHQSLTKVFLKFVVSLPQVK